MKMVAENIRKHEARDRKVTYHVQVRIKGYPPQTRSFEKLTDAKKWRDRTKAAILEGRYQIQTVEAKKLTLKDAYDRYRREILPGLKDQRSRVKHLDWLVERAGAYSLNRLTPELLAGYRDELAGDERGLSPTTVKRYCASWQALFSAIVKRWHQLDANPMAAVAKPSEGQARTRYLSEEEERRLLAACRASANWYLFPAVVASLCTGARQGELMRLRWRDVDWRTGRAVIEAGGTKNSDAKPLHLKPAIDVLRELHERTDYPGEDDPIFPNLDGTVAHSRNGRHPLPAHLRKAWLAALSEAKITGFRWHDLRHTAASRMVENGVPLVTVGEILGHRDPKMTRRYSHVSPTAAAAAVGSTWGDRFKE